ncbi:hypothetical protein BC937DRAFT_93936 [Endogone sp. FLAS-F59071]|nr:hypothetical protein BC937DRAFT_93936 [Endogone sp. FLAS-F59071]|eukprot:RUS14356.1 hypothetical protein BC937DRAFT_93936 [Endogone sp. FLAS-F59071]
MMALHFRPCFKALEGNIRISAAVASDPDPETFVPALHVDEPTEDWQGDGLVRVVPWWKSWEGALLNFGTACPPTNLTLPYLATLNPNAPHLLSPSHSHIPKIALVTLSGCTYRAKLDLARTAPVGALVGIVFIANQDPTPLLSTSADSSPLLLGQISKPNLSPSEETFTWPPDPEDDILGTLSACDRVQPVLKVNRTVGDALMASVERQTEPNYAYLIVDAAPVQKNSTTSDGREGPPGLTSRNWYRGPLASALMVLGLLIVFAIVFVRRRHTQRAKAYPQHQIIITYKDNTSGTAVTMRLPYVV